MIFPSPGRIARVLTLAVVCLTIASIAGQFSKFFLDHGRLLGLVPLFDLDGERNVPAWFSSSMLFLCGFLLAMIAFFKKTEGAPYALHWSGLSIIFLYLSLDEAISIREGLNNARQRVPCRALLQHRGSRQLEIGFECWREDQRETLDTPARR